jgi:hypothetical protein
MDQQVPGLQVLKEGRWIAVNPRPNAFVINIADQLQVPYGETETLWLLMRGCLVPKNKKF